MIFCHKLRYSNPNILKRNLLNLRYFKQWILLDLIILVWNIKGLHHLVAKIKGLESLSLWRRLNSFLIAKGFKINFKFPDWNCFYRFGSVSNSYAYGDYYSDLESCADEKAPERWFPFLFTHVFVTVPTITPISRSRWISRHD